MEFIKVWHTCRAILACITDNICIIFCDWYQKILHVKIFQKLAFGLFGRKKEQNGITFL